MSRIRSIHPGIFTDEAFMSASSNARVFILGIWTEAWDDGVFEWKPLTLKARIFPADNISADELLSELAGLGFITPFEAQGKKLGAIKNFQKWQRPKKPNSSGLLPPDLHLFVGKSETSSEPVPHQFGTSSEKSSQMEDGGGRKKEELMSERGSDVAEALEVEKPKRSKPDYPADFLAFWSAYPTDPLMSKKDAFTAWKRLDPGDRDMAQRGIAGLIEHQRKNPTYRMVHACRYLSQRRFEGLAAPTNVVPMPAAPQFETEEEFERWWVARAKAGAA